MAHVLLGLYDQPVQLEDLTSYDLNKIGGEPVSKPFLLQFFLLRFSFSVSLEL
jgi:hypothetical protein